MAGPDRKKEVPVSVAAKLLGYSQGHVRYLFRNGLLEGTQYGPRKIMIKRKALAERIEKYNFGVDFDLKKHL